MNRRRRLSLAAALVTGALMTVGLSGCFGEPPAPSVTPSPTGFASAEEAYAAAEETYRDFTDALNFVNEGREGPDPATYLTGGAATSYSDGVAERSAEGKHLIGRTRILDFAIETGEADRVVAQACLDVSQVRAINSDGVDVTDEGRHDRPAVRIIFDASADEMLISSQKVIATSC